MPTVSAATGTVPVHRDRDYAIDEDGLPPLVAARYESLVEQRDAAFAAVRASYERATDLRDAKAAAEGELARLLQYQERSMLFVERREPDLVTGAQTIFRQPDEARLADARRRVALATDRYQRQLNSHDALAEAHRSLGRLVGRIERYLQTHRGHLEVAQDLTPPKLLKNESVADAVERVRSRIGALLAESKTVARAPTTVSEAKAKMRAIVEELTASGRPDVSGLFSRAGAIRWPVVITPEHNVDGYLHRVIDGSALLAFVHGPALIAKLDAEIEAVGAEVVDPLPTVDRERRLREIEHEVLSLNYDEDALIRMAAETGHTITPRGSADVRAVLGLLPDAPPPRE